MSDARRHLNRIARCETKYVCVWKFQGFTSLHNVFKYFARLKIFMRNIKGLLIWLFTRLNNWYAISERNLTAARCVQPFVYHYYYLWNMLESIPGATLDVIPLNITGKNRWVCEHPSWCATWGALLMDLFRSELPHHSSWELVSMVTLKKKKKQGRTGQMQLYTAEKSYLREFRSFKIVPVCVRALKLLFLYQARRNVIALNKW